MKLAWPCLNTEDVSVHRTIGLGGKLRDYFVQLLHFICEEMETQRTLSNLPKVTQLERPPSDRAVCSAPAALDTWLMLPN